MQYIIKKNGMYLSQLLCDPVRFEAHEIRHTYAWSGAKTAREVAAKCGGEVLKIYQPNAPFGDWELVPTFTVIYVLHNSGEVCAEEVQAVDGFAAIGCVAATKPNADYVCAIPYVEGNAPTFAGECLVDGETILEQPDVYGV